MDRKMMYALGWDGNDGGALILSVVESVVRYLEQTYRGVNFRGENGVPGAEFTADWRGNWGFDGAFRHGQDMYGRPTYVTPIPSILNSARRLRDIISSLRILFELLEVARLTDTSIWLEDQKQALSLEIQTASDMQSVVLVGSCSDKFTQWLFDGTNFHRIRDTALETLKSVHDRLESKHTHRFAVTGNAQDWVLGGEVMIMKPGKIYCPRGVLSDADILANICALGALRQAYEN